MRRRHIERILVISLFVAFPLILFASSDRPQVSVDALPRWFFADILPYRDAILNLGSGYIVSIIFYFLLVALPEHFKKVRHRDHALEVYRRFKEDVIGLIFSASGKGYGLDEIDELMDPKKFRDYFEEDETGSGARWDEFLNGLDEYHRGRIVTELEILRDELHFLVSHHDVEDGNVYKHLKNVSVAIHAMSKTGVSYNEQKQWGRFLWGLFTLFDWGEGYREEDPIERAIARI